MTPTLLQGPARRVELDGLRALAVLLVVAGHASDRLALQGAVESMARAVLGNANLGVRIFFVLSGFLITSLLLQERAAAGRIDFLAFYARRARRILPAFVAYMTVIVALWLAGFIRCDVAQVVAALTFTWNYLSLWAPGLGGDGAWYLGHLWTLSMEEQFYLVWPLVVAGLAWRGQRRLALAVVVLLPVLRVASYLLWPGTRGHISMFFHTGVDSIVWGSLLALQWRHDPAWLDRLAASRGLRVAVPVALLVVSPLLAWRFGGAWSLPLGYTAEAALSVLLIVMLLRPGRLQRAFSHRVLVAVGAASYSIYLWQQLFLPPAWAAGWHLPTPAAVGLALLAGFASRWFIERPFLGGRSRSPGAVGEAT